MCEHKIVYDNCWVAYFDMLGFKEIIEEHKGHIDSFVRGVYNGFIQEVKKRGDRISDALIKIHYTWFSDTFVFYSSDDTYESYSSIDLLAHEFFQSMIFRRHPLRGALTLGEFYADNGEHTYVGPALIDAYEYTEKQNMIGFVLTPMARKKLCEPGYAINRIEYSEYEVSIKPEKIEKQKLFAHKNPRLKSSIEQMKQEAINRKCNDSIIQKYNNTLVFLKKD